MKAEFKITKEGAVTTLTAKGDLVAQSSAAFKEHLQQLLNETTIDLQLESANAVDVSAMQLIRSCHNELKSKGKKIQILPPVNSELIELLTKTGLIGIIQPGN